MIVNSDNESIKLKLLTIVFFFTIDSRLFSKWTQNRDLRW